MSSRLRRIFEAALERPLEERVAFVSGECSDDPALRQQLLDLLAAQTTPADPVALAIARSAEQVAPAPAAGTTIGPYRVLSEIGAGGMGTVLLAERADGAYRQQVAIKLIRGFPTREAVERLRRERQVLADLVHPHIARLLDGGETAEGQPYLVMEFVEGGVRITDFCKDRKLGLAQRVKLHQRVCEAVQFAHQHLVVHRDLKPSNVLVRDNGEPVLLDFGIAKLVGDAAPTEMSGTFAAFTPAYSSPEQRAGRPVTTATDIHGLGLLLYEMLADVAPPPAVDEIPPPSEALSKRGERERARSVRGDLDHVVQRATRPEPERRYRSAEAFADDLARHLEGRPIEAVPGDWRYRLGKFVGRHRVAVAAALTGVAFAAAFTAWLAVERNRARAAEARALAAEAEARMEADTAEQVTAYLMSLFDFADPSQAGGRAIQPRELIDRGRERLRQSLNDQPVVRARLLQTLGDLYRKLGFPALSMETLEEAMQLVEKMPAPPTELWESVAHSLAMTLDRVKGSDRGQKLVDELLKRREARLPPDSPEVAEALEQASAYAEADGRLDEAERLVERALVIRRAHAADDPLALADALLLATSVPRIRVDVARGLAMAEEALALREKNLPPDDPEIIEPRFKIGQILILVGRSIEAEPQYREILAIQERIYGKDSGVVADTLNELGNVLQDLGQYQAAVDAYQRAVEIHALTIGREATPYVTAVNNLASVEEERGNVAAAEKLMRESLAIRRKILGADNISTLRAEHNLGRNLMFSGQAEEARRLLQHAYDARVPVLGVDHIEVVGSRIALADWERRYGDKAKGLEMAVSAMTTVDADPAAPSWRRGAVHRGVGLARIANGDLAGARKDFDLAIELFRQTTRGGDHPQIAVAELELAKLDYLERNLDAARRRLAAARPRLDAAFVADGPQRREAAELAARLR